MKSVEIKELGYESLLEYDDFVFHKVRNGPFSTTEDLTQEEIELIKRKAEKLKTDVVFIHSSEDDSEGGKIEVFAVFPRGKKTPP